MVSIMLDLNIFLCSFQYFFLLSLFDRICIQNNCIKSVILCFFLLQNLVTTFVRHVKRNWVQHGVSYNMFNMLTVLKSTLNRIKIWSMLSKCNSPTKKKRKVQRIPVHHRTWAMRARINRIQINRNQQNNQTLNSWDIIRCCHHQTCMAIRLVCCVCRCHHRRLVHSYRDHIMIFAWSS